MRVAEMFAGVGGFRLALEGYGKPDDAMYMPPAGNFETVWANQWEPPGTKAKQFAWECYERRFGAGSCVNEDIEKVLDEYEAGEREIPDFDLLVGGFPCQDFSVAKPAPMAKGIEGKKGVLWWSIERMVSLKKPKYVLLENVDRLLKSPTAQRGRDFAIMLSCLNRLGYSAEWMVINAADYGMPQRRRRVFILATKNDDGVIMASVLNAFPAEVSDRPNEFDIPEDPYTASKTFGDARKSPFMSYGRMTSAHVWTCAAKPAYDGDRSTLGDVLVPDSTVPEQFFIPPESMGRWEYLKGAKKEPRTAANGHEYLYAEGPVAFPDPLDKPSRTILTSEGGSSPSRMKHVVRGGSGRLRRLVPDELDMLQMFPKGWTEGMSDGHRAFCMGNALVVGVPRRIGLEIAKFDK
jgi:DNA (cytosine-5)-methyltransferase 1